ncbi:hypothetical protein AWJ20_5239 [Sugiyamaella lignohabitans]|uniref:MOZ protein represents a chromatin-associated acetyltransferase n=1 Tax=Sugiyamaella lignohabitans TaxID=796027 RepID=A0A167ENA5_9ASCO|nr:uncharacterized protein AWJ20_5239 [Sugiyamaella lignohabitans]ANB14274.1 hypothetical protein AWJ20_5239 [Sugiyamaella lignohabitans]
MIATCAKRKTVLSGSRCVGRLAEPLLRASGARLAPAAIDTSSIQVGLGSVIVRRSLSSSRNVDYVNGIKGDLKSSFVGRSLNHVRVFNRTFASGPPPSVDMSEPGGEKSNWNNGKIDASSRPLHMTAQNQKQNEKNQSDKQVSTESSQDKNSGDENQKQQSETSNESNSDNKAEKREEGSTGDRETQNQSQNQGANTDPQPEEHVTGSSSQDQTPIGMNSYLNTPESSGSGNAAAVGSDNLFNPGNSTGSFTEPTTSIEIALPTERSEGSGNEDAFQSQRYFQYFDTQKIYSSLKYSGYTSGQADVLMRTMRDLLSRALTECQENAIPQWAAENEAYLFEAACSELKNEIQTSRQAQAEQFRADLGRLQRDVELLQHEIDEVMNTLKMEIDMEINERKNATRAEENAIQLKIQELNNKITIEINSDVKSEIEGLRWQTTRRGLMAVIFVAFILLANISINKKDSKPVVKRPEVVSGEEIYVPVLTTSEVDDVEDRRVETLR